MTALEPVRTALVIVLCCIGALFFFIGTFGMLRLPDFFTRTHAATKCDTVGAGSVLFALALVSADDPGSLKILLLVLIILIASPTSGHALARAAYRTGLEPWLSRTEREES